MDVFGPRQALDHMAERPAGEGYPFGAGPFYRAGAYGPFDAKTAFTTRRRVTR